MLKNQITKDQIRKELLKHYNRYYTLNSGREVDRQLIVFGPDKRKGAECTLFVLAGTPPKGYALFIAERGDLYFYDAEGKRYKKYKINTVTDLD